MPGGMRRDGPHVGPTLTADMINGLSTNSFRTINRQRIFAPRIGQPAADGALARLTEGPSNSGGTDRPNRMSATTLLAAAIDDVYALLESSSFFRRTVDSSSGELLFGTAHVSEDSKPEDTFYRSAH